MRSGLASMRTARWLYFMGGAKGSPGSLWESTKEDVAGAKAWLRTGEVNLVAMTFHSRGASALDDYRRWVDLALDHNPETRFLIQAPWPIKQKRDFAAYEADAERIEKRVDDIRDQLREAYPGTQFDAVYQGRWMVGLWRLYKMGELPEITSLVPASDGHGQSTLFHDSFGHGGSLAVQEGVLLWLATIYPVKLEEYNYQPRTKADLKTLATEILAAQEE